MTWDVGKADGNPLAIIPSCKYPLPIDIDKFLSRFKRPVIKFISEVYMTDWKTPKDKQNAIIA